MISNEPRDLQSRPYQLALPNIGGGDLRQGDSHKADKLGGETPTETGKEKAYYPHYTEIYQQIPFSDDYIRGLLAVYHYADVWTEFPAVRKESEEGC